MGKQVGKARSLFSFEVGQLGSVDHIMGIPTSSKGCKGGSENCGQAEMGGINSTVAIREGFPEEAANGPGVVRWTEFTQKEKGLTAQQREAAVPLLTPKL